MASERPTVLIADDEPLTRTKLTYLVQNWGYPVVAAADGEEAWRVLQGPGAPNLVILDWQMPGYTGDEICRMARERLDGHPLYMILITATRFTMQEKVIGLGAGADDYLLKPFDAAELKARLEVGCRLVSLQLQLRQRIDQLEEALSRIRQLEGLVPICMDCKRIRDDQNYWHRVEAYLAARTDVSFTHCLCPTCLSGRHEEIESR